LLMSHRYWLVLLAALLLGAWLLSGRESTAEICKWVDEKGVTHFAERCPGDIEVESVTIEQGPTEEQKRAAEQRSQAMQEQLDKHQTPAANGAGFHSLPLEALGPLPDDTQSKYLRTTLTEVVLNLGSGRPSPIKTGQFVLTLQATDALPAGSLVEVHFPNAGDPSRVSIDSQVLKGRRASLTFKSPASSALRCWNYPVKVLVYADDSREVQLGSHEQVIQSRYDLPLLSEHPDRLEGVTQGGVCPSPRERDMSRMSVTQLEALCEAARQKRLVPEREKLVANCVRGGKSRDYCERYFADWGDAQRVSPTMVRPALYYDLPECLAWKEAAEKTP